MKKLYFLLISLSLIMLSGCSSSSDQKDLDKVYQGGPPITNNTMSDFNQTAKPAKGEQIVVMKTSKGTIKIRLFPKRAPKTVENFVGLIDKKYYDGIIFHRVIPDFMIQGGDPKGNGTGGESLWGGKFKDEFHKDLNNIRGALSMANSGPNTNGSQFFIVQNSKVEQDMLDQLKEAGLSEKTIKIYKENGGTPWLDNKHSVFGQVIDGMDVLDKIANADTELGNKPKKEIKMKKVTLSKY